MPSPGVAGILVRMPTRGAPAPEAIAELHLPPEASAPVEARSWLRGHLGGWPDAVLDDAQLLVSELVTNAVLHARTPLVVRVRRGGGRLRVEVADGDPAVPVAKHFSTDATTGRGMQLLSTLSAAWGVERDGAGKRVWFELEVGAGVEAAAAMVPVRICGLPVAVLLEAEEHHDALLREFALLATRPAAGEVPARLLALAAEVGERFAQATGAIRARAQGAIDRADAQVDLSYEVPGDSTEALRRLAGELEEVDRWCEEGGLLTVTSPPAVRRFRSWYVEEISHQLAGGSPRPWSAHP